MIRITHAERIQRSTDTYSEHQGWKKAPFSSKLSGYYRTRFGSFKGRIERSSGLKFYIYNPPEELHKHRRWVCFTSCGHGKYSVHFSTKPKDVDSGIQQIERTLHEAFTQK